jgi:CRP-like cAMP-binding protein
MRVCDRPRPSSTVSGSLRRKIGFAVENYTNGLRSGNSFLDSLQNNSLAPLQLMLRAAVLRKGQVLAEAGQDSDDVWFPVHSIISVVTRLSDGSAVEVGVAGHEGMSALSLAFGSLVNTNAIAVQAAGSAYRISAKQFAEQLQIDPHLRGRLLAYVQYSYVAAMQLAACNRHHLVAQRYARSLLMASDRMGASDLKLTHEDSAGILGVRRAGVSVAAAALSHAGVIAYRRGFLKVLDRDRLEAASCECYGIVNAELYRCMGYSAMQRFLRRAA